MKAITHTHTYRERERERGRERERERDREVKSDSLIPELEEKQSKYLIEIGAKVKLVEPSFFLDEEIRKKLNLIFKNIILFSLLVHTNKSNERNFKL
jgi:hypothetical protein